MSSAQDNQPHSAAATGPTGPRSKNAAIAGLPSAPTILAVTADTVTAVLSWAPGADGGSPILGYEVTPYVQGVRQASQTFGPASTQTIAGLTSTVTYQFAVAARTAEGTGPESSLSQEVTANVSPTLLFNAPTSATVGIAYAATLNITHGAPPFLWSLDSGELPPGLTLNPVTNGISGVPTTAGVYPVVIRVVDAAGQSGTRLIVLTVNQTPVLVFPTPPLGEVTGPYAEQLTVIGGTAPFVWSLAAGTLPPGLALTPASGLISGRPTAAGAYLATIKVTDANGLSATKPIRLVIQPASEVTLTASTAATTFGKSVHFDVAVGPGTAEGTVSLIDELPNGVETPLGTFPLELNAASFDLQMPAFGLNRFRVQYDGTNPNAEAVSNTVTVEVSAAPGQLLIEQFAQSGVDGLTDQYVSLVNTTELDLPVAGFRIEAPDGISLLIPGTVRPVPPRRGFLVAAPAYSLSNIKPDLIVSDLGQGGLRLLAPDSANTVTDAAGTTPDFAEGTPLPAFSSPPFVHHAWNRLKVGGKPLDTTNNAADFRLVSTVRGPINGVPSALGSPSPQNSLGTYQQNPAMQSTLLDPDVSQSVAPNRVRTPGTLVIRRTITNRSGAPITQARVRITSLSQLNGAPLPGGTSPATHSHLRLVNPAVPTSSIKVNNGRTLLVRNLAMDLPATTPPGGGLATTLTIPLDLGGLAPGASVHIALTFAVDTPGPFWLAYDIDALGGSPMPAARFAATTPRQRASTARRPGDTPTASVVSGTLR
ncbi:putative Ig domain-containing protein [Micromonospora sp. CPCC 205561]|uniref:putative Ig domain-containing protein n=1 Tax=Micromonospora sp. CPCC 205561 TaxID=3122407 RepID=UPI002FF307CF